MSSLSTYKITNAEVENAQVEGRDRVLRGTVRQNQSVFDEYADLIKRKFNALVDAVDSTYVVNIDDETIEAYQDIGWTREEE